MDRRYREELDRQVSIARSRRQVLGAAAKAAVGGLGAAVGASGLGGRLLDGGSKATARALAVACVPPAEVLVRPNVYDLTPEQIASLRRGIAVMKSRDEAMKTSWIFQAGLHAVPAIASPVPTWCQHTSWFFFPWHRMYLYWFERILRKAAEDPKLALPYWNYTDNIAHRFLPEALRTPMDEVGDPNPLFEAQREPLINAGWGVPESAVNTARAFGYKNFAHTSGIVNSFGGAELTGPSFFVDMASMGRLEAVPHGQIHVQVGGAGESFGQRFDTASTFAYHCEIHPDMVAEVQVVVGTAAEPAEVTIFDFGYDPPVLEVPVGTTVIWTNAGDFEHTVTADDGTAFRSVPLAPVGLMRSLFVAARDPVFWMHHANIDRLWNRWLEQDDVDGNPTAETWTKQKFPFFDEDGNPVEMAVEEVLNATDCLGYRYDDDPPPAPPDGSPTSIVTTTASAVAATPETSTALRVTPLGESDPDQPIQLGAARVNVPVDLADSAGETIRRIATRAATPVAGAPEPRVAVALEGIKDRGAPAVTFEVYYNLPRDTDPDIHSEYFVGVIDLFGLTVHGGHHPDGRQEFDVTPVVSTLNERGDSVGEAAVTFFARGLIPPPGSSGTPGASGADPFARAQSSPWVTIERIIVAAIE